MSVLGYTAFGVVCGVVGVGFYLLTLHVLMDRQER